MAIANSDGSIVLTTKVEDAGLKSGMAKIISDQKKQLYSLTREYARLITNNQKNTEEAKKLKEQINGLSKEIKETEGTLDGFEKTSKNAFASVEKSATAMAFAISAAVVGVIAKVTKEIIEFSKASSEIAMQQEASVLRLVDIYGEASDAVGDFIDANATALGMSKAAAASYASVYGNLFSVWADQATNAELTNQYLQMTAVVASKTGRTVEDVQERVRSGLLGNTEAIEDLGIFVNVKTIEMTDAFQRMANGKSWEQLGAYTQQQIRSMAILEQATSKYGDEVSDTAVLSKSKLSSAWQDFQATWGRAVNTVLIPILNVVTEIVQVATIGLQTILGYSGDILEGVDKTVGKAEDLNDELKETQKIQKGLLAGFDQISILRAGSSSEIPTGSEQKYGINVPLNLNLKGTDNVIAESTAFKEKCEEILSPLREEFGTLFDNLETSFLLAKETVFVPLSEWFEEEFAPETIQKYSDNIDGFSASIDNLNQELEEMGETPLASFFSSAIETISGFVSIWLTYINDIFSPIFSNFSELTIVIDVVWGLIGNLGMTLFSGFSTQMASLITAVVELFSLVGDLMGATSEAVATMWSLITGDFDGAKQHFENMLIYLANAALSIVNVFIAALNFVWMEIYAVVGGIINGIGGALEKIAQTAGLDWDLTWDASKKAPTIPYIEKLDIPKLAQGTVVPPNKEFMAVLGDNTQEHEIVSPISTMKQAFMEAMVEMGGAEQTTKEEHYYLSETQLMSVIYKLAKGGERLNGESLISGGAY